MKTLLTCYQTANSLLTESQRIPEIFEKNGIFFILVGPPASGKSTLVDHIIELNPNIKLFDTDEIMRLYKKRDDKLDVETAYFNVPQKTALYVKNYLQSRIYKNNSLDNAVYVTSGMRPKVVKDVADFAHGVGYKVVAIHFMADFETIRINNLKRERHAPEGYMKRVQMMQQAGYNNQEYFATVESPDEIKAIQQGALNYLHNSKLFNKYYIVVNIGNKLRFYKFNDDGTIEKIHS
jgi:predicted kinase